MKKVSLDLNALKVETFDLGSGGYGTRGTVRAHGYDDATFVEAGCVVNPLATRGCIPTYGCGGGQAPSVIPVCQPPEEPSNWSCATCPISPVAGGCGMGV